jgi:predicted esterase
MGQQKKEFSTSLPITYIHRKGTLKSVVIFLHGYTDSGASFLRRALREREVDFDILAPNGPFPLPVRSEKGYKEAFAWYFWDYAQHRIVIHPKTSVDMLLQLVASLGLEDVPKVIVGFSQGGFLAPFLARELSLVKGIITVGSSFRPEEYPVDQEVHVTAIHGDQDEIIPHTLGLEAFEKLLQKPNVRGDFNLFKGLGHTMNEESSDFLIETIQRRLSI